MLSDMSENNGKSTSEPASASLANADGDRSTSSGETFEVPDLAVPAALAGSGTLDRLVNTAKDYARQALGETAIPTPPTKPTGRISPVGAGVGGRSQSARSPALTHR